MNSHARPLADLPLSVGDFRNSRATYRRERVKRHWKLQSLLNISGPLKPWHELIEIAKKRGIDVTVAAEPDEREQAPEPEPETEPVASDPSSPPQPDAESPKVDADMVEAIQHTIALKDLYRFGRYAWRFADQHNTFGTYWHQQALCEHLEAFYARQITHLVVNLPPGMGKSIYCSTLFPAWIWANDPTKRILCASHRQSITHQFARWSRNLIRTDWYQVFWDWYEAQHGVHVEIRSDADQVGYYENTVGGWRQSVPVGGGFSTHPHYIIIDDPYDPNEAMSSRIRDTVSQWYFETIATRGAALNAGHLINMQRLHESDIPGLVKDMPDYTFLILPMEYDPKIQITNPIDFHDPRTQEGELLCPQMISEAKLQTLKFMPAHKYAGQYQQQPTSARGEMFQRPWFENNLISELPLTENVLAAVRFWDKAYSDSKKADWTCGCLMLWDGDTYYVADVARFRARPHERDKKIRAIAEADAARWPRYIVALEEEYGPGKQSAEMSIRSLAGFKVRLRNPKEGKPKPGEDDPKGWEPYVIQLAMNNIKVLNAGWTQAFIDEHCEAPNSRYDDQVDASSGAFQELAIHCQKRRLTRPLLLVTSKERKLMDRDRELQLCTGGNDELAKAIRDHESMATSADWVTRHW